MQAQRPQQPEREILTDLEKVGKFFDALAKKLDCHRDAELAEAIGIPHLNCLSCAVVTACLVRNCWSV
jgi:hypothetical protein